MTRVAVIMAGGTGTRFWPLSRKSRPKQLLSIGNHPVMLQATIDRLSESVPTDRILVVTSDDHADKIHDTIDVLPARNIIVEPEGRDTAACSGLAAVIVNERFGSDAVIGTFPADHRITPLDEFTHYSESAYRAAAELDGIVTFGIEPTHPATGYGYILPEGDDRQIGDETFRRVDQFTEKPDRQTAMKYVENRGALWNSGMFFWPVDRILTEFQTLVPELYEGLMAIRDRWQKEGSLPGALSDHYGSLPENSVDYAILEQTSRCWTLPVDFNWNDLGTWSSVEELFEPDGNGNVTHGDVVLSNSRDNIIYESADVTVGVVGVEETVVVVTDDAILVCPKDKSEEVKSLVNKLQERGRTELL